jgi:hypothetical protein
MERLYLSFVELLGILINHKMRPSTTDQKKNVAAMLPSKKTGDRMIKLKTSESEIFFRFMQ